MRRVILESPYAGDVEANVAYAKRCLADSLSRGEAPLASHLLYPQVLDDNKKEWRLLGMTAGFAWLDVAEAIVVYIDLGISDGMLKGISAAKQAGIPIEERRLNHPGGSRIDKLLARLRELRTTMSDIDRDRSGHLLQAESFLFANSASMLDDLIRCLDDRINPKD